MGLTLRVGPPRERPLRRVARRQLEEERGAAPLVPSVAYLAAVRLDDAVAHRQSESGAFSYRLGGEKRLKELRLVFRRHTRTVVLDFEAYLLADVEQPDHDAPFRSHHRFDRLLSVDHEVERHLLQLGEVRLKLPLSRRLDV